MYDHKYQIIFGTLLGNSKLLCIEDNFVLHMRSRNELWIKSKANELKQHTNFLNEYKGFYNWRSKPSPIFKSFNEDLYKNKNKYITMDLLDRLKDLGIAIWYGDTGCLVGRTRMNACLRTQSFRKKGNEIIAEWFNSVGISCKINKHRHSYVIVFSLEGTRKLFKMIAPLLPANRYYLLG